MAFTLHYFTKQEGEALKNQYHLADPYGYNFDLYCEAVDTEQNIHCLPLVGDAFLPAVFALIWRETVITVYLFASGAQKRCFIKHVYADTSLLSVQEELKEIIRTSLSAFYTLAVPSVKEVLCEFEEDIQFMDCSNGMYSKPTGIVDGELRFL